ncbi:hypothetical protein BH10PAT2_BH10PAT2_1680 [soil metagenome]
MKSVSVIIPNYNGHHLMALNLPSVIEMLQAEDEVIIVDDASTDDSVEWLKKEYHLESISTSSSDYNLFGKKQKKINLVLVQNLKNVRFAASCNRGVSVSKNQLVFLLNTDVKPHSDTLEKLVPHFEKGDTFGVGCLEREIIDGREVSGGKNILQFERGMFIHNRAPNMLTGETAWVSGGSGLFDRSKWDILKGFDTAYSPAYWEDVDLSFRARERGWKVLFEASAKVDHNHESTNTTAFGKKKMDEMSWRNANYFAIKNGSWLQKILYVIWRPYWSIKMSQFH